MRLTTDEIMVIIKALESITIKGKDAPLVAGVIKKVQSHFEKMVEKEDND